MRRLIQPPGPILTTVSGKQINVLDPDPASICIGDIAHALSLTCRWVGHVREFYSVADHSVRVSDLAMALASEAGLHQPDCLRAALHGLMHDAAEAYTGDLASPIKDCALIHTGGEPEDFVAQPFRDAESVIQGRVLQALQIPSDEGVAGFVHAADRQLLITEDRDLRGGPTFDWTEYPEPLPWQVRPLGPDCAKAQFLARWRTLKALVGG